MKNGDKKIVGNVKGQLSTKLPGYTQGCG